MIHIYTGLPGAGKTLKLASVSLWLLRRNKKYFDKSGIRRLVYSNIKFNKKIEEYYKGFIVYWTDIEQVAKSRQCDVVWQEMSEYLDSQQWEKCPVELRRWVRLHRHYGIDVYGDNQYTKETASIKFWIHLFTSASFMYSVSFIFLSLS